MDRLNLIATLENELDLHEKEGDRLRAAIAALKDPAPAAKPAAARAKKKTRIWKPRPAKRRAVTKSAPRRSSKPKKGGRKLAAPHGPDVPRKLRGRMPSKGLEVFACSSDADRLESISKLRADGFVRARVGQRMEPGTYDVIERDGESTVLWRPKAPEKAAA